MHIGISLIDNNISFSSHNYTSFNNTRITA
jgi:hypothetical protein